MGKRFMVAGAGISGINACRLLLDVHEEVLLYDGNKSCDEAAIREKLGRPERGLTLQLGELQAEALRDVVCCVLSPGISPAAPFLTPVYEAGIPLWSEIELAYRYARGRLAAITGTNGKTTTTALLGQIVKEAGQDTYVVGNIGRAYTADALSTTEDSVTVAEISSFQLETAVTFHPQVSAVLNITPDHLDRHGTMDNYAAVKLSITKNQTGEDLCVLNYEDGRLRAAAAEIPAETVFFSSENRPEAGAYLDGSDIYVNFRGYREKLLNVKEMKLPGRHNYENVMAAVLMALGLGIGLDSIRRTVRSFAAVEHRIEYVTEANGVVFYNDSKGTNPDAAIKAICAMDRPTVLIAGGYDKGGTYDEWIRACVGRVRRLVLIGATAEKIRETALRFGITEISCADSMEDAVRTACGAAQPGDAVLLSPACASWDMFRNYEERGRRFKELVKKQYEK